MRNNAHDVLVELLREETRAEEPGGRTPTPEEWAAHMDSIAARAVAAVDMDTVNDTDINACSSPKDLTSAAEGTDNAMATARLSDSEGRQGRTVLVLLVAMATGLTAWLFVAGAASVGAVTGTVTALVAILTGLGKTSWLLGHGRRDHSAREGLMPRSQ